MEGIGQCSQYVPTPVETGDLSQFKQTIISNGRITNLPINQNITAAHQAPPPQEEP